MTNRENILRAIHFDRPERIPVSFQISPACWSHYDQNALQDLMEAHKLLFPDFARQAEVKPYYACNQLKDSPYTDPWGCVWQTGENGITGSVHGHPLADWSSLDRFTPPDPENTDGTYQLNWDHIRSSARQQKENGEIVSGGLSHGHTFLRLQDLRGYENLIFDMQDGEPRLERLIGMVHDFNYGLVKRWLEVKPDIMSFPEDLGMQIGPMLSPDNFRRYIKPVYQSLMKPARQQGCIVHMHSDGDIRTLVDDLIDGGVQVINLQDLVNGIDWIAARFAGKTCIELDIDRQAITAHGTPGQIDALIRNEVETLGSTEGGLMMIYGLYPGVPLRNIEALMSAMQKYSALFS